MPTIAVVGGGFGGTSLIKELDRLRQTYKLNLKVLLFDPDDCFIFSPLLHEVATWGLEPEHVKIRFAQLYRNKPWIRHIQKRVTGFDETRVFVNNKRYAYDFLVLATGSTTNFYGIEHRGVYTLKSLEDALNLRKKLSQLAKRAERRDTPPVVAVVGGGPTGVELAPEIKQFFDLRLKKAGKEKARVQIFQGGETLLPGATQRVQSTATKTLEHLGIEIFLKTRVARVRPRQLITNKGLFKADLIVWVAGVAPNTFGTPFVADERLRISPKIYALGDSARSKNPKKQAPALAQAAVKQGNYVARSIVKSLMGKKRQVPPFNYQSRGFLVSLGQRKAVAEIKVIGIKIFLRGFFAWWLWRTIYLLKLLDTRQRVANMIVWTSRLFTKRRMEF